ncbi:MAG: hypothetical protein ACXW30_01030 [Micavibrio sp.]
MSLRTDFNHFAKGPTEGPASEARELLLSARTAVFEMKRELAESKASIPEITGQDIDIRDRHAVSTAKADYVATLNTHVIDSASSPEKIDLMRRMYGLYEKIFPIESEREEFGKLLDVLEHNTNPVLQQEGAPFKQQWIVVENPQGEVIAARYFSTFSAANNPDIDGGVDGTQHLTYSFVDPKYRSLGLGDHTMQLAEEEGRKFIAGTYDPARSPESVSLLQFCEQNSPLKMTAESLLVDTRGAKTDQFWRRDYYEKMGFREIAHDYIQVPLRPRDSGGESVDFLDLLVRERPGADVSGGRVQDLAEISAANVGFHVYNTSKRSFAAGQYDVDTDPDWIRQSRNLDEGMLAVRPRQDFMSLKDSTWNGIERSVNARDFEADAFENQTLGEMMGLTQVPLYRPDQAPDSKIARLKVSG